MDCSYTFPYQQIKFSRFHLHPLQAVIWFRILDLKASKQLESLCYPSKLHDTFVSFGTLKLSELIIAPIPFST